MKNVSLVSKFAFNTIMTNSLIVSSVCFKVFGKQRTCVHVNSSI